MKEPSLSRRRRPTSSKKLKLVCSFNGVFQRRPLSSKLRYLGGETRIVSVDRNIGFLTLRSKISELCPSKPSFSLKYQLSESGDTPLVSIASDDDVRCMIEEFDRLELYGRPPRLWVFVCNDNDAYGNGNTDVSLKYVETLSLITNVGGLCEKNGVNGRGRMSCVKDLGRLGDNLCDNGNEPLNGMTHLCKVQGNAWGAKNLATGVAGVRHGDEFSLRKMVVKQQSLSKQSEQIQSFCGKTSLNACGNDMEFTCGGEIQKYEPPLIDLTSELQVSMIYETTDQSFENPYQENVSEDYKIMNTHLPGSQTLGNLAQVPASDSQALNPRDGNLHVGTNSSAQCLSGWPGQVLCNGAGISDTSLSGIIAAAQFSKQPCNTSMICMSTGCNAKNNLRNSEQAPLSNVNRENIMLWSANCGWLKNPLDPISRHGHLLGSAYPQKIPYASDRVWASLQNGIRNHQFGVSDTRNQLFCSHHIHNHWNNLIEIGNNQNVRLGGRSILGKCYPGLRPSSNISKQGLSVRFYHPNSWKAWYSGHDQTFEGKVRMVDSSQKNQQFSSLNVHCGKENLRELEGLEVPQCGKPNSMECHLTNHGARAGMADQSPLSCHGFENSSPCVRAMDTQEDLITGSNDERHEVSFQAPRENLHGEPINFKPIDYAIKIEPLVMDPHDVNISGHSNDSATCNGTELGCYSKLLNMDAGIKSMSNHQKATHTLQGDFASLVDISLYNLSLSSSKQVEPQPHSALAVGDVSERLLKPLPKLLDLMDVGHFSSGPQVEKSNGVVPNFSSQAAAKLRTVHDNEDNQHNRSSSLSISKKDDSRGQKCFKVIDGIPSDLAAFYAHLATQELQTIKNSDLECIKELGSGTYGTVFYGKWKGSDVAIKRIKPSCFTEGAMGEDRLVADFWKEAHILGQLHHPNIVALYGVVRDGPVKNLATVTEYMVNGSLKQVLQRKDRTIDRRKRLIIAMDAAFGVEYLHEKNIVHFDLKSHNFLVNMKDPQRPVCKIGDLGLSKIKQKTLISGGVRGTIPWMAPELLDCNSNLVTEKVDVYSFGIVMWELLTGEEPHANMRSEEIIAGIIKGNLRPEIPSWCDPAWRSLMERCWSSDPGSRPAFSEIAKQLRAMSAAMNIK